MLYFNHDKMAAPSLLNYVHLLFEKVLKGALKILSGRDPKFSLSKLD